MHRKRLSRRSLAYLLIATGAILVGLAWVRSFPASAELSTRFLNDSIYPSFWVGLSATNVGLFLIASRSASRLERFICSCIFLILVYSIKYFFTFLGGPDIGMFLGLTENFAATRIAAPEQHFYYQWPGLFVSATIASDVLGMSVPVVAGLLFFVWTFLLAAGLFLYTSGQNDSRDFLSVIAYVIGAYIYLNWQFAAWTFGLTLLLICFSLVSRSGLSYRIVTIVVYGALVLTHAFLAVFMILSTSLMAVKNRGYRFVAVSFGLIYASYTITNAAALVVELGIGLPSAIRLFLQYESETAVVLLEGFSPVDVLAQVISRAVVLSMWGVLSLLTVSSLLARKLRATDIGVGLGASFYALVGAILPVLGYRTLQIVLLPAMQALRSFTAGRRVRRVLLAYFLLSMMMFPLGAIYHTYYNNINYMTLRERHAVETVFLASAGGGAATDFTMLVRVVVQGYASSKSYTHTWHITEGDRSQYLMSPSWFRFVFMSPELEKALIIKAGLTESQLSDFKDGTFLFSRIYSNGQVSVLLNSNVTALPELKQSLAS